MRRCVPRGEQDGVGMIGASQLQLLRSADPGAVLPGIDTAVGNPDAASSLIDYTTLTQSTSAPYHYSPSANKVIITQNGAVLNGINFGSAQVDIAANNVTIENCTFDGSTGWWATDELPTYTDQRKRQLRPDQDQALMTFLLSRYLTPHHARKQSLHQLQDPPAS